MSAGIYSVPFWKIERVQDSLSWGSKLVQVFETLTGEKGQDVPELVFGKRSQGGTLLVLGRV